MDRRMFVKCSATGGLVLATAPAALVSGCNANWITVVENDLPIVIGIANSILGVISTATGNGLIAAAVSAVIHSTVTALSASLTALKNAISAYSANTAGGLGAFIDALKQAQQDARAVMASLPAGSLSATWQLVIIAGLGTIVTILSSVQSLIPGAAPVGVTAKATVAAAKAVLPNSAALKTGFNSVLWLNGYTSAEIS